MAEMPPKLTVEGKRNVAVARTDRVPYIRQISPFCIFLCFIFIYFFHFSTEPSALFFIFRPSDIRQISLFYFILFYFFSIFPSLRFSVLFFIFYFLFFLSLRFDRPLRFILLLLFFFLVFVSTDFSVFFMYYFFLLFFSSLILPF